MFQGRGDEPLMLVGQAPGIVEVPAGRPFAGRSGRELARWMERAGLGDGSDSYRDFTYMTSVTKCFSGRSSSGGDRRPSTAEVVLCQHWLRAQLEMVRPRLLILVGQLAASRFLPAASLDELLGAPWLTPGTLRDDAPAGRLPQPLTEKDALAALRRWPQGGRSMGAVAITLPHPSGASRWLNAPGRRDRLREALACLGRLGAAAREADG